jgi:hypothetical protein
MGTNLSTSPGPVAARWPVEHCCELLKRGPVPCDRQTQGVIRWRPNLPAHWRTAA